MILLNIPNFQKQVNRWTYSDTTEGYLTRVAETLAEDYILQTAAWVQR